VAFVAIGHGSGALSLAISIVAYGDAFDAVRALLATSGNGVFLRDEVHLLCIIILVFMNYTGNLAPVLGA
jgi:hypothetical protein